MSEAQRLRQLEVENAKLKRIVADQALDNVVLKDTCSQKTGEARRAAKGGAAYTAAAHSFTAAGLPIGELQSQECPSYRAAP